MNNSENDNMTTQDKINIGSQARYLAKRKRILEAQHKLCMAYDTFLKNVIRGKR